MYNAEKHIFVILEYSNLFFSPIYFLTVGM